MAIIASNTLLTGFWPEFIGGNVTIVGESLILSVTNACTISSIAFMLANYDVDGSQPAPSGFVNLSVYAAGVNSFPVGSPLATNTTPVYQSELPDKDTLASWLAGGGWREFDVTPPITIDIGVKLAFCLSVTDWNSAHATSVYVNNNQVLSGALIRHQLTWPGWALSGSDTLFSVTGELIIPRNPARPDADLPDFPADRPDAYAPDDFWIPGEWNDDVYTPPEWSGPTPGRYFATGGGRWGQQLVAVGHGLIYYEELT